jgi:hypothetical protein
LTFLFFFANNQLFFLSLEGIRPEWEDKANARGGKWVFSLKRDQKQQFDRFWLFLVSCVF